MPDLLIKKFLQKLKRARSMDDIQTLVQAAERGTTKTPKRIRERLQPSNFGLQMRDCNTSEKFEELLKSTLEEIQTRRQQGWSFMVSDFLSCAHEDTIFNVTFYREKKVKRRVVK